MSTDESILLSPTITSLNPATNSSPPTKKCPKPSAVKCSQQFTEKCPTELEQTIKCPKKPKFIIKPPATKTQVHLPTKQHSQLPTIIQPQQSTMQSTKTRTLELSKTFPTFDEFRKITYNNYFEFCTLFESLDNLRSKPLQLKVNSYLQQTTNTKFCFFIYVQYTTNEMIIELIGTKLLQPMLIIQDTNKYFWNIANVRTLRFLKTEEIEPSLKYLLEDLLLNDFTCKLENFAILPVYHPKTGELVFHYALTNFESDSVAFNRTLGIVGEILRYTSPLLNITFTYEEERQHHEKTKSALTCSFKILEDSGDFDELNKTLRKELCSFFDAERCYILLLQNDILTSKIVLKEKSFELGYENLKDVKVPYGEGLQGKVASNEKLLNFNCENIDKINYLHKAAELNPRNVLCFPMFFRAKLFGIIEMHDKVNGTLFTKLDEEYTLPLGIICGTAFGKCISLKQFEIGRHSQFKGDVFMLRKLLLKKCDINQVLLCSFRHDIEFNDYKLIPQKIPEKHVLCYCLRMLYNTGLLQRYNVSELSMVWFLSMVRNGYSEIPFHNWYHAFAVFHYMYILIYLLDIVETGVITTLEAFAMLIAALCHDIEFRGATTKFQPIRGNVLASLYSSPGNVDKSFSASQTIRLFSLPDANIAEEMSPNDFKNFIFLIETLITSLDLWQYSSTIRTLEELLKTNTYNPDDKEHRKYLYAVIMVACDLCSYGKSWSYCKFMSECQYKELFRCKDVHHVIEFFNIKHVSPNLKKMPLLQVQFMKNFCIPTFNLLRQLIPDTEVLFKRVESNLKRWQQLKTEVEKMKTEEIEMPLSELLKALKSEDTISNKLQRRKKKKKKTDIESNEE